MANRIVKYVFFLLVFFGVSYLYSSNLKNTKILTLKDAVRLAIKNNRSILIATLTRDSDRQNLIIAKDKFNIHPNLSFSVDYSRKYPEDFDTTDERDYTSKFELNKYFKTGGTFSTSYKLIRISTPPSSYYSSALTMSFTQPFLKGFGKKVASYSLLTSKINDKISIRTYQDAISSVIQSTIIAFRNLVIAQRQFNIVKKSIELSKKLIEINKELVKAGRLAKIDLAETKADLIYNKIQLLNAKNMVENAQLQLVKLLGLNPNINIKAIPEKLEIKNISKKKVIEITFKNRREYLNALDNVKLAELSLNVAKNNMLWDLNLVASVSSLGNDKSKIIRTFKEPFIRKDWDFRVGMVLNIPLSRVVLKSNLIQAKNKLMESKIALQQLKDDILTEIRNLLFKINTAKLQIEHSKALYEVSKVKLNAEIEKYKVGKTSNFQLLSYKSELVQAEINLLSAKINYMNLITQLERAEGILYKKWANYLPPDIKRLTESK